MALKDVLDGIDLIAARLRGPLQALAGIGVGLQVAIAAGGVKVPPDSKWSNWVAIGSIVLAYFTTRGQKETVALEAAHKIEEAPKAGDNGK